MMRHTGKNTSGAAEGGGRSLYRQLAMALALLVTVVSVVVNLFNYLQFSREAEAAYQAKSAEYAEYLRDSLEWPLWNIDDEMIAQIGGAFASSAEISTLVIRDDQQREIFRQDKPNGAQGAQRIAIEHKGQQIGSVEIGLLLSIYEERERQLLQNSIMTMVLLILVLLGATGWILSRTLKRPMDAVIAATNDMVAGKYQQIAMPETYREFDTILSGFKTMSEAVASRENSLREINESLAAEIIERKHAEESLRASEERLHLATMAGNIGIWDWDVVNNELAWDESMYALYGIRREDFGGAYDAWIRTLHPEDREYTDGEIQAALRGEREYAPEFRIVRTDGSVRNIKAASKTYYDDEGKPVRMIGTNIDITERQQAEEQLRKSEHSLTDAQRIAHLGNWELDLTSSVLTWSDEIFRIFEIDKARFGASYEAFLNAIHPDDREMVNKAYIESVASKVPYDIVHRLKMPDGRIKYVNERCETYYAGDGKPMRSVGTVHDITASKLDEEALQRLNRELRAISNCNQALMRADDERTLLDAICRIICDDAGYRMAWVGYPEDDAAKTIRVIARAGTDSGYLDQAKLTWADTERGRGPSGTAIRSGQSAYVQDFFADPNTFPWRAAALERGYRSSISLPLKDEQGSVFGILNIYAGMPNAFTPEETRLLEELAGDMAFGITVLRARIGRQQAVAALQESEEKYRTLIQKIRTAVVVHGADTRILVSNPMAEELLGLSEEQMQGKSRVDPDWRFFREDGSTLPVAEYPVNQALASRKALRNLVLGVHRSSQSKDVWVLINADPVLDRDGELVQIIVTFIDITARKQAEEELRRYKDSLEGQIQQRTADLVLARNAADTANRAKSVFLANMSHELRTPLNAILGFSSMMRKDSLLQPGQVENLDIINRSGEHLLTLINDVLEMSKIEAGRVQVENAPFDLGGLVRDVGDMMQVRARDKGLQLLVEQSSKVPRYLRGDEARLRQVLINLVGNAVKFTQQGGVTLRFGVKPNAEQSHLLIEVEDSGVGIRPEDQQRIFEPFVQLDEDASQKGTGLGLPLARQYAQLMGGKISLESTPGMGTVFRVELPLEAVADAEVVQKENIVTREVLGLAPGQPKYRILIAEDQHENQLLLKRLMENIGMRVKVAENGEQARALFQSWHPHLIWMDRRMPVMDGIEATRRIRALPEGGKVKIVAVTASAFTEQRDEMLRVGMNDFIRKPYRFNEIYEALARQLGVRYTYADEQAAPAEKACVLTPEMMVKLPSGLRDELRLALESLEGESITSVIGQVESHDPVLKKMLSQLADNYDYPAILQALKANTSNEE